jgi:leucyl aminopeptidase
MKISNSNSLSQASYKVVIVEGEESIEGVSADVVREFINGKEDFVQLSNLSASTFLVKNNVQSETNRKSGAKVRALLPKKVSEIAFIGNEIATYDFLEGFLLASYQFNKYFKDSTEKEYRLISVLVSESFPKDKVAELENIQKAVFWARNMVNEPVSFLTAEQLAEEIKLLGNDASLKIQTLEKTQIESLKMGGLLAVNKGSIDPPTFSIIEYKSAAAKNNKPIVLVGKGVVYDTGGLSLKPTPNSMDIMKSDMGGAACVVGAIYLAALQNLPLHIIALVPATDNRPGLNAYAPGDVVKMFDGTTVEVLNTDAEGRMILADALAYSKKYDPELVIDAATLTGAAARAIGSHGSIIMGNADDKYFEQLDRAGLNTFERVVRFPFWDEYYEEMKSPIADLKNIGGPSAGMITAGKFLEHFVKSPYIHMDIAGPAWLDKNDSYRTRGGSGVGVRLLYDFLKNYN